MIVHGYIKIPFGTSQSIKSLVDLFKMFVLDDVYYFNVFKYDFIARKCGSQVVE